jgi:hypothetical protein
LLAEDTGLIIHRSKWQGSVRFGVAMPSVHPCVTFTPYGSFVSTHQNIHNTHYTNWMCSWNGLLLCMQNRYVHCLKTRKLHMHFSQTFPAKGTTRLENFQYGWFESWFYYNSLRQKT